MDFSETIAVCDLKVGRCRQLIEIIRYVSIEGQGHFFTIHLPGFVCFAKISGERLQGHWSSGLRCGPLKLKTLFCLMSLVSTLRPLRD